MQYGSSYADGDATHVGSTQWSPTSGVAVLPPPPPSRLNWSTLVLVGGLAVCFVALLATIAGIPASIGYDDDAAGKRNDPDTSDPMALTKSLDANMKWIDEHSADAKGAYVGYIKSINESEAAIPAMAQSLGAMDAALQKIQVSMLGVIATSTAMNQDLTVMTAVATNSAETLDELAVDVSFIAGSMSKLETATKELTTSMASIQKEAGGIATNGTSTALAATQELNDALPADVPLPILEGTNAVAAAGGGNLGTNGRGAIQ